jgi:RimJ/RimL family protein N-acetyltransferase
MEKSCSEGKEEAIQLERIALVRPARWQLGEYVFRIRRHDGVDLGEIAFRNLRRRLGHAELGIEVFEPYRGRGYGPEAIGLLLDELFDNYGLRRVFLRVHQDNERARRVYAGCGFRDVQVVRWPLIGWVRYVVMEITRDEHLARRAPG